MQTPLTDIDVISSITLYYRKDACTIMERTRFGGFIIASAGYNAQCEILEIEFLGDRTITHYKHVPEDTWYAFKKAPYPDTFFHIFIKGRFPENTIS